MESLKVLNETCIKGIFGKESISKEVKKISKLQWEHFKEMIPKAVQQLWVDGLKSEEYCVKLCGAGGGGYFLLFADEEINIPNTKKIF